MPLHDLQMNLFVILLGSRISAGLKYSAIFAIPLYPQYYITLGVFMLPARFFSLLKSWTFFMNILRAI
jgi:hypothetical protein